MGHKAVVGVALGCALIIPAAAGIALASTNAPDDPVPTAAVAAAPAVVPPTASAAPLSAGQWSLHTVPSQEALQRQRIAAEKARQKAAAQAKRKLQASFTVDFSKAYAKHYMKQHYGWGNGEYQALIKLWNQESSWDYHAENASSGAYGIPQSLPASKMASEGKDWKTDPRVQIRWGLAYIKSTYGSPSATWAFHLANGWY